MFFLNVKQNKLTYIIISYVIGFSISTILGFLVYFFYPKSLAGAELKYDTADFIAIVITAPVIETLVMTPIIALLKIFLDRLLTVCIINAVIWSVLHSIFVPAQIITIFPQFFIFTLAYLVWEKESRRSAYVVVMSIHILNNLTVFIVGKALINLN